MNVWFFLNQMFLKIFIVFFLNEDEIFNFFGYDVEKNFVEIVEEGDDSYKDFYYFYRFKMFLYNCKVIYQVNQIVLK